jgi:hypothetical protein
MKRLLLMTAILVVAVVGGPVRGQPALYISPDVPTTLDAGTTYLPWEVVRHDHLSAVPYTLELSLPDRPAIDALHKMDRPDNWLFSFEHRTLLAGLIAPPAEPRDVVRDDAGVFSLFFDGSCVAGAIPPSSSIDSIYLEGGDVGDLVMSFDVPTSLLGTTYQPSQLLRWKRIGPGPCAWVLSGSVVDFASIGTYFPLSSNLVGADFVAGKWLLAFDIPVDLGPPAQPTRTPGRIMSTDGLTWSLADDLRTEGVPGWPVKTQVNALSCQSNPGAIDPAAGQILLDKSGADIEIICPGGCSSGAEAYGLYEGKLATVNGGGYDHVSVGCGFVCAGTHTHTPPALDSTYYLLVPHNGKEEGSYGKRSDGADRPQAAAPVDRCVTFQNLAPCP